VYANQIVILPWFWVMPTWTSTSTRWTSVLCWTLRADRSELVQGDLNYDGKSTRWTWYRAGHYGQTGPITLSFIPADQPSLDKRMPVVRRAPRSSSKRS